ncbi:MAG: 4Fe-4S dicluster domain-containing protein [Gammaproteobacteria bacterium]|nr:4Fe-4S dicluster domain-containing protein [Gammaproteobacteria bacterium]MBU1624925.1 4Fe-4S dicluster domain-containing protein [Gammaproteobacteria bacterium]MBU1982224.1 4Fe-4S dicluster domain-containing protein [Gammaproteobacteria bacterium]
MKTQLDWSGYESYGSFGSFDFGGFDESEAAPAAGGGYAKAAAVCMGKRHCQNKHTGVMCPSYRATDDEKHSTHHRAVTLKAALDGELGEHPFLSAALAEAMEYCVSCKGCKSECPHGVDMALLRVEAMAQRWQQLGGIPLRERLFAFTPRYAKHLKHLNLIGALRLRVPLVAKAMQRWLGIAAQRSLPKAAAQDFLSSVPRTLFGNAAAREVVLLVDTFSNHLDPQIAQAALDVLQAAGYTAHIAQPAAGERALCCGRTFHSNGLIDEARAEATRMLDVLSPFAERGLPIIGLEPSCLLMLRDEYHSLGLGERVGKVANAAVLLEEFLAREHDANRLGLPFRSIPEKVLVHGHCHQKAFGVMPAMSKVLGLVPDLQVEFIESSCCGMAGSFGMEAEHYEVSMQMGELSLLPTVRAASEETLLIANGTSCRHQIRDGAARESLHLAQVLQRSLQAR